VHHQHDLLQQFRGDEEIHQRVGGLRNLLSFSDNYPRSGGPIQRQVRVDGAKDGDHTPESVL
jgi:hypothetical protein